MHGRQDTTDDANNGEGQDSAAPGGRQRVYEVARDVGLNNRALVAKIQSLGIVVKNHMSSLDSEDIQRVKRALAKERQENLVEKRVSATVIRRRSKVRRPPPVEAAAEPEAVTPAPQAPVAVPVPQAAPPSQVEAPVEPPTGAPQVTEPAPEVEAATPQAPAATPVEAAPAVQQPEPAVVAQAPAAEQPVAEKPAAQEQQAQAPATPPAETTAPPAAVETRPAVAPGEGPNKQVEATPGKTTDDDKPKLRYAPGFKPGMTFGRDGRPQMPRAPRPGMATENEPISAADALRMMASPKPRVVITDLDHRKRRSTIPGRGAPGQDRRYRGRMQRRKRVVTNKKGKKTEITTPAQHKRILRLQGETIPLSELAMKMGTKANEALKRLWALGMTSIRINGSVDLETATLLAGDFGYEIEDVSFNEDAIIVEVEDSPEDLQPRAPVVTVMGHVDHGKTSLLDALRNTKVASGEAGGITQHIGASQIETPDGMVVFLDTPGHEAFTRMRARGANCTDIVILVVAANDGVMPQTVEALDHARTAEVPIIVAVNKIDLPDANTDRVRSELADRGLIPEEWGGETMFVDVSAKTKENLDGLLEAISLQAEVLELGANPDKPAKGMIIESRLDKARGAMSSVLIQEGTLRVGDTVVTGEHMGKVRAMLDEHGRMIKEAGPCTPVELLGLGGVPEAGDALNAVEDDKAARVLVEHRRDEKQKQKMGGTNAGMSYEQILQSLQSGAAKELKLLVKADVHGSAEAVKDSLIKLSTAKVSVTVISAAVGGITENDVNLAKASGAFILGFSVRSTGKASLLAEKEGVEIRVYDIIYEMLDEVKVIMTGLLPSEQREKALGKAEVRETYTIPRVGVISGCAVTEGKIRRNCLLRLVRDNIKIYEGKLTSLRRFKDDVKEVVGGYECGIGIEGTKNIKVGDIIEAYEIEEVAPTLE